MNKKSYTFVGIILALFIFVFYQNKVNYTDKNIDNKADVKYLNIDFKPKNLEVANVSLVTEVSIDNNDLLSLSNETDFITLGRSKFELFSSQFEDIDTEGVTVRRAFEIENECGDNARVIVFERNGFYAGKTVMSSNGNDNNYDYSYTGPSKNISYNNQSGILREEYFPINEATNYINNEGIGYFTYQRVVIPKIIDKCFVTKNSPFLEFVSNDGKILYVSAVTRHPVGVDWPSYFSNQKPYFFKEDMEKYALVKQDNSHLENYSTRSLSQSEIQELINTNNSEQKQKAIEAMGIEDSTYIANRVIYDSDKFVQQTSIQRLFEIYDNQNKEDLYYHLGTILISDSLSSDILEEIQIKLQWYHDNNIEVPEDLLRHVFSG